MTYCSAAKSLVSARVESPSTIASFRAVCISKHERLATLSQLKDERNSIFSSNRNMSNTNQQISKVAYFCKYMNVSSGRRPRETIWEA